MATKRQMIVCSIGYRIARFATICGLLLVAAVPLVVSLQARAETPAGRFGLEQIWDLQWAGDVEISPNGQQIAFVRSSFDVMHDGRKSSVWVIDSDGSKLHQVSGAGMNASGPRWSPDGEWLLFVSSAARSEDDVKTEGSSKSKKKDKTWDLRVLQAGTSAISTLATVKHKPGELAWSPDGTQVAFSMFVPEEKGSIANMPAKPKGADWGKEKVMEISRLVYRRDGRGYLPTGHVHLFVLASSGGTPRQVTFGDFNDGSGRGSLAWSRDGKALIFSATRRADAAYHPNRSDIYEVSLQGGEPRALTNREGPDGSPVVSPDGSKIAYTGFDDRGKGFHQNSHLYVMNRDGTNSRRVTSKWDRSVGDPQWSADGRGLYFQYVDQGITKLGYVTLDGSVSTIADILGGGIDRPYAGGQYSLSPATGKFAFLQTAPGHPSDVAVGQISGKSAKLTRLTHLNQGLLGPLQLGTLETIHFTSSYDQRKIEGWIMKPPGFDPAQKYPLLLEIHGGPSTAYGPTFSAEIQHYAALGYVVLYINPRGSTSYGQEFADLINHDYPDHDYDDLMSGVDAVLQKGYIDPQRLYVTGGSGGGVLTAWIVGHTDRFRAAVVAKPVINWYSWVLTADMGYMGMKYWMEGYPWENLQHYMARSPISYVGNVKTPTMVVHGEVDYRTPAPSAIQFYSALKMRGIQTVLVRIPGASHEIAEKPRNLAAKLANITGWFACYGGQSVGKQTCPYAAAQQANTNNNQ